MGLGSRFKRAFKSVTKVFRAVRAFNFLGNINPFVALGVFGFVNWAYLSDETQDSYIRNSKIYKNEWKSGVYLWLYDIVIIRKSKEVMSWVYNYFKKLLKTNESISWLRLDENDKVYRVAKKYKREFHK